MKERIEFHADDGVRLIGWAQLPAGEGKPPIVVMTQGLGGHKEWALPGLSDVLAEAGIASLAYDHRNFGESGGESRYEVDPQLQIRDYRSAITFAQSTLDVDPDRVGVFGTSLSGGHALVLGAIDRRIRCVVAQVPTISGWQQALRRFSPDSLADMRDRWDADRAARFRGGPPEVVPHAVFDPEDELSGRSQNRVAFYEGLGEVELEHWDNKITLRSSELCLEYEPGAFVSRVSPTPLLMIVAEDDRQIGTDLQLAAYEKALQPKSLVLTKGGHYNVYGDQFDFAASAARDWFARWLLDDGHQLAR